MPPLLPVDDVLDDVATALAHGRRLVIEAPPGAGKTTRVPPCLAAQSWAASGRIVVLEPRRVAARAAAARMAAEAGGKVGDQVGLTTRDERRVSRATRIEVVTEGVLVRRLERDPGLDGVAAVVLDEFHERSLDADLALALAVECQALREDLRIVVMSATLDGDRVAAALACPVVRAEGRRFPVTIHHVDRDPLAPLAPDVAAAVTTATRATTGDVVVFLPGAREIRDVGAALNLPATFDVRELHGSLSAQAQDAALAPAAPGRRKVVLSTDLAESSVTVPGVDAVVDAGLAREPRFHAGTGMSRLVTVRASRASAEQRAGRAGRLAPGACWRLWSRADHAARDEHARPAVLMEDLAGMALTLAVWGAAPDELMLLDPPPRRAWDAARALLADLAALDGEGRPTAHGRAVALLPLHPRLGHLLLIGAQRGWGATAAATAAVLADRDLVTVERGLPCADVSVRVAALEGAGLPAGVTVRDGARARARRERTRLARAVDATEPIDLDAVPALVALAYPDRLGLQRGGRGRFVLANGRGAVVDDRDPLAAAPIIAVADVDDGGQQARVRLAAALDLATVRTVLPERIRWERVVGWDDARDEVVAEEQERLGTLVLATRPVEPAPGEVAAALAEVIAAGRLDLLGWTDDLDALVLRSEWVRQVLDADWPDLSRPTLEAEVGSWLVPFLTRVRRRADLARVPLRDALAARIGWDRMRTLDRLAPTHVTVPSGSRVRLDYADPEGPVLAVRVQEMFGATATPRVGDGRVAVLLHLLSPARRPVQVTRDLDAFWRDAYPQVRAELRGRYPKHAWPTDPLSAAPTRSARGGHG